MRVYLPSTTAGLHELIEAGSLGGAGTGAGAGAGEVLTAVAVTPGLREWYSDDGVEELEYNAMIEAARASLRLLDAQPSAARRRVVLAADVADDAVRIRDDMDRGVVHVPAPITIAQVVALHVDGADAETTIDSAAKSIMEADLGETTAQNAVDDAEGFELCWYASQEIAIFLELL